MPRPKQKSSDLFMETRYLDEADGRARRLCYWHPISNSMGELYTIQRYLQYRLLQEMGLSILTIGQVTLGDCHRHRVIAGGHRLPCENQVCQVL